MLSQKELEFVWKVRKALGGESTAEVTEKIISMLLTTKNNEELINN